MLAIFFMLLILDLIRRDRLQERYSVIWFVAGLGMLAGAAFPGLLELVADLMGVRNTNVALFSIVLLLLLGLALNFSVIMSRQAAQITRLAQERAIEKALAEKQPDEGAERQRLARRAGLSSRKNKASRASSSETFSSRPRRVSWTSSAPRRAAGRVELRRPASAAASRRSRLKTTSSAPAATAARSRSQARAELEAELEDLGAAAAAGAFGAVGDLFGAAFDPRLRLLFERFAGGGFDVVAGGLGAVEQALSTGRSRTRPSSAAAMQRSTSAAQLAAPARRAAAAPARGRRRRGARRRRSRPASAAARGVAASSRLQHLGRQRRELDRLAARGDRLQQALAARS